MEKRSVTNTVRLLFILFAFAFVLPCQTANAAEWCFPVGLTGITGFGDVVDLHKENLEAKGYIVDSSTYLPVGITFQPYVQFENGLRLGGGLGPFALILIDSPGTADGESSNFYDLPVNLNIGYTFLPESNISPYIKAGGLYHFAGGDYVEDISPGFFGAAGIEFFRKNMVSLGLEIAYDTSTIH